MSENDILKCVAFFRERMERCEGKLSEDRNHWRWVGKNREGYIVEADIGAHEGFISLNFQYNEEALGYRGEGHPCHKVAEVEDKLERLIAGYKLKSKDYEQMKLW